MGKMMIRGARTEDADQVRSILTASYRQYDKHFPADVWEPYLVEVANLESRSQVCELFVAENAGSVVGCVSYYPPAAAFAYAGHELAQPWPRDWAAIRLLAVEASSRGSGVGRILTETCIARAREQGASAVGLHTAQVMTAARTIYKRMGFERVPEFDFGGVPDRPETVAEALYLNL